MELLHSGKVRDVYADDGDVLLVASDKVSVYDVVLPTLIPDKGKLLTQLSVWWFGRLAEVMPNHLISSDDVPAQFAGRAMRCRRLTMLPVECVARGYLSGSGWKDYQRTGTVSGVSLPDGLREGDRLPEAIFTPSTKAPLGEHDRPITFEDVTEELGAETAIRLREATLEVYRRGAAIAAERGIIIADTKLEFGRTPEGELLLADELLTPDSSRFWPADGWKPGGAQPSFDKQFVRDWATGSGWDGTAEPPAIPGDIVTATRDRYIEAYERLSGASWR